MHLCAQLTAAFWTFEPFGEIGANFSLQLSSRTWFDKINKKKVIAENQCEKHKKSSLELPKLKRRLHSQAHRSLFMSKCHIVGNHVLQLIY